MSSNHSRLKKVDIKTNSNFDSKFLDRIASERLYQLKQLPNDLDLLRRDIKHSQPLDIPPLPFHQAEHLSSRTADNNTMSLGSKCESFRGLFKDFQAQPLTATEVLPSRPLPLGVNTAWPESRGMTPGQGAQDPAGSSRGSEGEPLDRAALGYLPVTSASQTQDAGAGLKASDRKGKGGGKASGRKKKRWAKKSLNPQSPGRKGRGDVGADEGPEEGWEAEGEGATAGALEEDLREALKDVQLPAHLMEWVRNSFQPSHEHRTLLVQKIREVLDEAQGRAEGRERDGEAQPAQSASLGGEHAPSGSGAHHHWGTAEARPRPSLDAALSSLSELERLIDEQHGELVRRGLLSAQDQSEVERLLRIARGRRKGASPAPSASQVLDDLEKVTREFERRVYLSEPPVAQPPAEPRPGSSSLEAHVKFDLPERTKSSASSEPREGGVALTRSNTQSTEHAHSHSLSRRGSMARQIAETLLGGDPEKEDLADYMGTARERRPPNRISFGDWDEEEEGVGRPGAPTPRKGNFNRMASVGATSHGGESLTGHLEEDPSNLDVITAPSPRLNPLDQRELSVPPFEGFGPGTRGSPGPAFYRPSAPTPKRAMGVSESIFSGTRRAQSMGKGDEGSTDEGSIASESNGGFHSRPATGLDLVIEDKMY